MRKSELADRRNRVVFWKIAGAGASFQAGSSAVDSATVVASLVNHLTGNVYAVGAVSVILRLGWLLPQMIVGFLAQKSQRRMPFYVVGAFGRASVLAMIAAMLAIAQQPAELWVAATFLVLWTLYAFVSGIVAVPYNDIVGRSIVSNERSRMLAWRFFGGGVLALGVAMVAHHLLNNEAILTAYALIFALAAVLMIVSSISFVSAGEPPPAVTEDQSRRSFPQFVIDGLSVVRSDTRFRLFLFTQWLSGATLMALPFYVVAAMNTGLNIRDVGILLGAQTLGSLTSNLPWGRIGDRRGKLTLLKSVGVLRLAVPLGAFIALTVSDDLNPTIILFSFATLFFFAGALSNGMTISYLGFLMEISPENQRPAYSAWFNALASPAALLPLLGALIADVLSLHIVFVVAVGAALLQMFLYATLDHWETRRAG